MIVFLEIMGVEFVGKSLLLEIEGIKTKKKKRILVISDLHLGYEGSVRREGVFLPMGAYEETINDMNKIFEKIGKVDMVVILGDLKHEIGAILEEEWKEVLDFIDYLSKNTAEIIIVKGNHDVMVQFIIKARKVKVVDNFIYNGLAFLHGDRDFKEIYNEKIKTWVMGHLHPAINLKDKIGVKEEKYKCFLIGRYKGKKIIILPSFFPLNEGSDPRHSNLKIPWKFKFGSFNVKSIGENLEVLDFGRLGKL